MQLFETNYALASHNTFGLSSVAQFAKTLNTQKDAIQLANFAHQQGLPFYLIGTGSNLILRPKISAVVGLMNILGRKLIGSDADHHFIKASAGEDWPQFVIWTIKQGFSGLENLAGIPGTVGAAPVQNIGAYGLELAERLHALTAYDVKVGAVVTLSREECGFSYRNSVFKATNRYIVLDVTFALPKKWRPVLTYQGLNGETFANASAVMDRVLSIRAVKLPDWKILGNAGSFFHNPVVDPDFANGIEGPPRHLKSDGRVKLSAAWLIDACGLKGKRIGGASVYEHHALILVNLGEATFEDVSLLAKLVQTTVYEQFGVSLVQEPLTF
ncbi:UDP-N-acetylmuramate dehydrogenase [Brucella sp. NBRC 12950]|uniref:UDP-N-acetylmuramate dehydrogenase n=1 Tax=Brucella sp. NBRC 12950 TaxID=2994518 RepID=UPI0024A3AF30|nr:UDP-N-acetylmuramate dehydrogenase [Brucella sp. NBRC 12950]GLU29114.1 UDP-N-acetylenolpyruvoylglucosamine reductase [Brucella sp. NBRC 12950]